MNNPFFSYNLPPERIAQHHAGLSGERSSSKLLHAVRGVSGELEISDCVFANFPELIREDDLIVLNDTKVLPFRFFAKSRRTDGEVEILLLQRIDPNEQLWEGIGKPLRKVQEGDVLELSVNLRAIVVGRSADGRKVNLKIEALSDEASIDQLLVADGSMPIPPYIRKGRAEDEDKQLYQTVYANTPGSIAAPTAGLHFTSDILHRVKAKGAQVAFVTLHVGLASFTRVEESNLDNVTVPTEFFSISEDVQDLILKQKAEQKRVIAVGTTTTRALESWARFRCEGIDCSKATETSLFLSSGAQFLMVDALVTNFHQPQTTHLLMVSAFIGAEQTEQIYNHALQSDYRFLSYGDSMFLERD